MSDSIDLYISVTAADAADGWVAALISALAERFGEVAGRPLRVAWRDDTGADDANLRAARAMLTVLSPSYFTDARRRAEWVWFAGHELDRVGGGSIVPVYAAEAPGFADEQERNSDPWKSDLGRRQLLDVRAWRAAGDAAWERADVHVALEALATALADLLGRSGQATGPAMAPPHNPRFVGRAGALRALHLTLTAGRVGAIAAICGLAGVGKSALAFEYAHAFAGHYLGGRFLVDCAGAKDLRAPTLQLAEALGVELTEADAGDLAASYSRVRAAFQGGARCLLILDNVDDARLLNSAQLSTNVDSSDDVHVVVTTRLELPRAHRLVGVPLDELPHAAAVELIDRWRPLSRADERAGAAAIATWVGGHPLALELAAAYLAVHPEIGVADWAARLADGGLAVLDVAADDERVTLSRHTRQRLSGAFASTLDQLSPAERCALNYAATFDGVIDLARLRELTGRDFPAAVTEPEPGYPSPWRQLVRRLVGWRLLTRGGDRHTATMPRIVQIVATAQAG